MKISRMVPRFLRQAPLLYKVIGAVIVCAILLVGIHAATREAPTADTADSGISHVAMQTVASLSAAATPLPITGTVTSQSEATILAQTAGEIVSLNHSIGDHVAAGAVIGEFENSSQAAAVIQAEGAYEAAQASLDKATGATAENSGITSNSAATAAQNAESALETALRSAYASLDDAVHTKTDPLFADPRSTSPTLLAFTIPNTQLVINIENDRSTLDDLLDEVHDASAADSDVDARAALILKDAGTVNAYLNLFVSAMNQAVPSNSISASTIATDQGVLAAARTETIGAISSVTSAKSAYDSARSSAEAAANTADSGLKNDIAAAEAQLKSAQGALEAARANFEKTVIRSPIAGTIVSLPVTKGDYVSTFSQVAIVSNPSALYVDAHVTPDDAATIAVGTSATINGTIPGVVTFIAPALDPSTGKIEVKIGISDGQNELTVGEVTSVSIERHMKSATTNAATSTDLMIPIVAAKLTPEGPVVFSVSASSTLEAHPVVFGSILGDRVVVSSGITPDMQIVTDARGLSAGERVILDAN